MIFGDKYYLYNEQFIVKPPETESKGLTRFPLHRDSDPADCDSAYTSLWIALDDMTSSNGALHALSYGNQKEGKRDDLENLFIKAGDIVLLAHDMWHGSNPNTSRDVRRAYMMQFSQMPMIDSSTGKNVALAVPIS